MLSIGFGLLRPILPFGDAPPPPPETFYIVAEDGGRLVLEDGSGALLQE